MPQQDDKEVKVMVDHLFRHESGKMVAVLTRLFGFPNIEQAEDIVQDTLLKALETWKFGKLPANPQAWLYHTAKNKAIDIIRRQKLKYKIDNDLTQLLKSEYTLIPAINEMFSENEIADSQLRMMFGCCHPSISTEAQISLILKTLCGLSVKEIANAFLTTEETIAKRLYRTKEKIRNEQVPLDFPGNDALPHRIEAVLKALYLLFNEGYSSSHTEKLIREDLCEEALRLAIILSENTKTDLPETSALLALMCFQASRFDSRIDDKGFIVLLKDQDRSQWNKYMIQKGNEYITKAARGVKMHEFHYEAAIASVHANAETYEQTDWQLILGIYDSLLLRTHNPVVALNRCLALAEVNGFEIAISELEKLTAFRDNPYYYSSLADLHFRSGDRNKAKEFFMKAISLTGSNAEMELINRKLSLCV